MFITNKSYYATIIRKYSKIHQRMKQLLAALIKFINFCDMKIPFTTYTIFLIIIIFVFSINLIPSSHQVNAFHTPNELNYFKVHNILPPVDSTIIFPAASSCEGCHGKDAQGNANIDEQGNDVNVHDDWRATMMANSAKDPFWRAKVSHEVLVNPSHQADIETKCTSCHAPQGHFTAIMRGAAHYGMDSLLVDTIGLDGVSCSACHQIKADQIGELHSGNLLYDTSRVVYGPYDFPFSQPMQTFVGFAPIYSEHINDAGICAPCHTLVNESSDLEGNPTGTYFVEQATYHEWLNSIYAQPKIEKTCQSCHMPRIEDEVRISNNYINLPKRTPFALHELVGANSFMLQLMKTHRDTLGINASAEDFDATIAATNRMLREQTLDIDLSIDSLTQDTAFFKVHLKNKAGHKFPSGYPSRRAVLEFLVISEAGDTLFQSGSFDPNYEVQNIDAVYEPHYDIIRSSTEAQIYEFVTGNVANEFTTILEQGAVTLKDNRLAPIGFTSTHSAYDTTFIAGKALEDPNFNKTNGIEGSGSDLVFYNIPLEAYTGDVKVLASVWYQALPPRWLAPMLEENTPEINLFQDMYVTADHRPSFVGRDSLMTYVESWGVGTQNVLAESNLNIYPNPSPNGQFSIALSKDLKLEKIIVYNLSGQLLNTYYNNEITLTSGGMFIAKVYTNKGIISKKLLVPNSSK